MKPDSRKLASGQKVKINVLVVLLINWINPWSAMTMYPSGIKMAIMPSSITPPPIPRTAEIEEVIKAESMRTIVSINKI